MLKLRDDEDGQFTLFVKEFSPSVVGRRTWTQDKMAIAKISECVTPSDEAFGLLLLYNSYERWDAEIANELIRAQKIAELQSNGKSIPGKDNQNDWGFLEVPPTKFTMDSKASRKKEYGGWTDTGKLYFNSLIDRIEKDRKDNAEFEIGFQAQMRQIISSTSKCKSKDLDLNHWAPLVKAKFCLPGVESDHAPSPKRPRIEGQPKLGADSDDDSDGTSKDDDSDGTSKIGPDNGSKKGLIVDM